MILRVFASLQRGYDRERGISGGVALRNGPACGPRFLFVTSAVLRALHAIHPPRRTGPAREKGAPGDAQPYPYREGMSALGYAHGATLIAGAVHATSQRARSHRSARQNRRRAPHFTAREPTIRWLSQRRHGTGRDDARQAASIGGVGFSIDGFWGKKEKRTDAGDGAGDGKGDGKGDAGGDGGVVVDPVEGERPFDEPAPSPDATGGEGKGPSDGGGEGGEGNGGGDRWGGWGDDDASGGGGGGGGGSPGGGAAPFLLFVAITLPTTAAACARWADANPAIEPPWSPNVLRRALRSTTNAFSSLFSGISGSFQTIPTDDDRVDATATVSVVVPALNEEAVIGSTLKHLASLDPQPLEVIVAVGDSSDGTASIAESHGAVVVSNGARGRSRQMNAGALRANGDVLIFLHADTQLPTDAVNVARRQLCAGKRTERTVLGGFVSLITVPERDKTYWFLSTHNVAKTFYTVLAFRPKSFALGLRCLFGDQAMFCRRRDFEYVGGFDENLPIMEDADLCVRMHTAGPCPLNAGEGRTTAAGSTTGSASGDGFTPPRLRSPGKWIDNGAPPKGHDEARDGAFERFVKREVEPAVDWFDRGRVVLVNRVVTTSGRRIEDLGGNLKATFVHFLIGFSWYLGASPERMVEIYNKYYSDVR